MKVAIIMGSNSDWPVLEAAEKTLKEFGVETEVVVASAHRTPDVVQNFAKGDTENAELADAQTAAFSVSTQKPVHSDTWTNFFKRTRFRGYSGRVPCRRGFLLSRCTVLYLRKCGDQSVFIRL